MDDAARPALTSTAAPAPRSGYGRGARILSVGIATTGLVTFAYFSVASYVLDDVAYKQISLLWSLLFVIVSVPREPLWRTVNMARGAYLKDLGNTPGHVNHWSKRSFVSLLERHGEVVEARSPFPWTMLLVRL